MPEESKNAVFANLLDGGGGGGGASSMIGLPVSIYSSTRIMCCRWKYCSVERICSSASSYFSFKARVADGNIARFRKELL